jgi:DNA polymerase elongation subunit (family B)
MEILIKTNDIVQELGYEIIYADTDSVFIKRKDAPTADATTSEYKQVVDTISKETGLIN